MLCDYVALDGNIQDFDLDAVVDVIRTYSYQRPGWNALVIYVPSRNAFVELRSSPPNVHGDSDDEAQEISEQDLQAHYRLTPEACAQIRQNPRSWILIDERKI